MTTFWQDIVEAAGDETIEAVVIGEMGWSNYNEEGREISADKKGVVLTPAEAEALLSYDYHTGHGSPECHSVYAWTDARVLYTWQYDGATGIESAPRNPQACMPEMAGG